MRHLLDTGVSAKPSETLSNLDDKGLIDLIGSSTPERIEKLPAGIKTDPEAVAETITHRDTASPQPLAISGWKWLSARRPTTKDGRLIKVRKNMLFSLFLLLEDLDASGRANIDHGSSPACRRPLGTQLVCSHEAERSGRHRIWGKFNGVCPICGNKLEKGTEEYDHIRPWIRGGPTSVENGRPVHTGCHQRGRKVGLAPVSSKTTA